MQQHSFSLFRVVILSIGSLLFSSLSSAQFTGIGIETGPGSRILFGNEVLNDTRQQALGFTLGINTSYRFNDRLSVKSGIYYELKGSQTGWMTFTTTSDMIVIRRGYTPSNSSGGPIQIRSRDNFNFISVPLLLKINLGKERHWYLNAGVSIGYLMGVRVVNMYKDRENQRYKPINEFYSIEYCALFGVGYETKINSKWNGHLEIRNHLGLNNLLDAPVIVGNGTLQTNSCYLLAGMTYRLCELW